MTSTPAWSRAVAMYRDPSQMDRDRAAVKAAGGTVIETADLILWGVPCIGSQLADEEEATGQVSIPQAPDAGTPDTWLIWLCAGDVSLIPAVIPHPLEWVVFARRNKLRVYRYDELVKRLPLKN